MTIFFLVEQKIYEHFFFLKRLQKKPKFKNVKTLLINLSL